MIASGHNEKAPGPRGQGAFSCLGGRAYMFG